MDYSKDKIKTNPINQTVINQMLYSIMDKFEGVNGDCKAVCTVLRKDDSLLDTISPRALSEGFNFLAKPLEEKPESFPKTILKAFGQEVGEKINQTFEALEQKENNKATYSIASTLEKMRNSNNVSNQKKKTI